MSQFLSSYTREGWEVKTMSVERRRTALFWSREAHLFVLRTPPLTACAWFTRLSQAFLSVKLSGLTDIALLLHFLYAFLAGADHAGSQHGKAKALIKRNFIGHRIDKYFAKGQELLPDGQHQLLPVALSLTSGDNRHIRQIAAPGAVADGSRHGNQLTVLIAKPAEGALAERLLQLLNITLIQPGLGDDRSHSRCQSTRAIASLPLNHHHDLISRRLPEARSSMPRQDMPDGKPD